MLVRLAVLILSAATFVGCASPNRSAKPQAPRPTAQEVAAADIGDAPDLETSKAAAMYWAQRGLIDPASAQFVWPDGWTRGYCMPSSGDAPIMAWVLSYQVNAKNKLGGYTGFERRTIFAAHGKLVADGEPLSSRYRGLLAEQYFSAVRPPKPLAELAKQHAQTFGQLAAAPAK